MEITWLDGLAGGLLGGLAQALLAMAATAVMGQGWLWPLALIGHMFLPLREDPDRSGGTVLKGVLIHLLVTGGLGVLFALLAPLLPAALPLWAWGMLFGALVFAVNMLGLLQAVDPTLRRKLSMGLFFASHLVFGGVLGWWLAAQGG